MTSRLPFWKCLGMILARTVALLGLLVTPAYADDWGNCAGVENPDRAIRACTKIINKGGKTKRKRENLALAYLNRGAAYANRGLAHNAKGDYDRAVADFDKAIQLKPDVALAYANRGRTYLEKGDYDRAIADCDRAIQLKPDDALAYATAA